LPGIAQPGPFILGGVGLAALISGGVILGIQAGRVADLNEKTHLSLIYIDEAVRIQNDIRAQTAAGALVAAGGALALGGAIAWRLLGPRDEGASTVTVAPIDQGGLVAFGGRW
jgi:hypothetical protein